MSFCYNNYNRNSCRNGDSCSCGSDTLGASTGCSCGNNSCNSCSPCSCGSLRPPFHLPPQGAVCGTCPPGTRPCPCPFPFPGGYSCGNNSCSCGCNGGSTNSGTYAFFNSTGSTLTTGSIIPLRYVIGSGQLGRGTTGGAVSLDSGVYSVEYSLGATTTTTGATITVTPEYLGALHPEYSRSFTTSAADQTFDIAGSFVMNLPTDTTLSLVVTITEPEGSTATTTLTGANASMLIRRISCSQSCS